MDSGAIKNEEGSNHQSSTVLSSDNQTPPFVAMDSAKSHVPTKKTKMHVFLKEGKTSIPTTVPVFPTASKGSVSITQLDLEGSDDDESDESHKADGSDDEEGFLNEEFE